MSEGFFDALIQITRERKVDRETLLEALAFSLRSAVRIYYNVVKNLCQAQNQPPIY